MNQHRRTFVTFGRTGLAIAACLVLSPPGAAWAVADSPLRVAPPDAVRVVADSPVKVAPDAVGAVADSPLRAAPPDAGGSVADSPVKVVPEAVGAVADSPLAPAPSSRAVGSCAGTPSDLDLNGDGYDDAVVGDPYATVAGKAEAGAIVVLYGDADRKIGEGKRSLLTQASVPGSAVEAGDHFGWAVAVDDVTGDGCADILVGSPGEDVNGFADAGIAHLISFVPDGTGGPGAAKAVVADQSQVAGAVEAGDQFGYAVALSNTRGGDDPLGAIGAPGEDLRGLADAGVVNTFSQLTSPALADQREQGRLGDRWLPGTAEAGDRFGASVLIAPMQAVSGEDTGIEPTVVAGAPGDHVKTSVSPAGVSSGSVTRWDRVTSFQQVVTQESPGVPGTAEQGDQFGYSLAFSEPSTAPGADGDLVVGTPGEDVGSLQDAGAVTVLADVKGSGLQGMRTFNQDSYDFGGNAEAGDRFGHSVAVRSGTASENLMVVGAPFEDVGSVVDAGLVQTVAVDSGAVTYDPVRSYTENAAGTPGRVTRGNKFGVTVSAMVGAGERVFTASSPYQGAGSVFVVNAADQTRAWVPGVGGVPTLTSGRFGWSVSGLGGQ